VSKINFKILNFKSSNYNFEGCDTIAGLQRPFNVGNGTGDASLPPRVHVPRHSTFAHLYELRRTTAPGTHSLHHWNSCQFLTLQETFPVISKNSDPNKDGFLQKLFRRLPDDVWLVDLDSNRISGPTTAERDSCDFVPALPETEAAVLRTHLKHVIINSLP